MEINILKNLTLFRFTFSSSDQIKRFPGEVYFRNVFGTYTCDVALFGALRLRQTSHSSSSSPPSITCSNRTGTTLQICSLVWKSDGSRQGDCDLSSISGRPPCPSHPGQGARFRGRCHAEVSAKPPPGPLLLAGPAQRTQGPIRFRSHSRAAMLAPGLRLPPGRPATAAMSRPAPPGTAATGAPGTSVGSKEHADVRARAKSGRTRRGVKGKAPSHVPDTRDCRQRTSARAACSVLCSGPAASWQHVQAAGGEQGRDRDVSHHACLLEQAAGAGRSIPSCGYRVPGTYRAAAVLPAPRT